MTQPAMTVSARLQALIFPIMVLLGILVLSGLADVAMGSLPLSFGEVQWRWRMLGGLIATGLAQSPMLAIIAGLGVLANHRQAVRISSGAILLLGIIMILAVLMFPLDYITVRRLFPVGQVHTYDLSAAKGLGFGVIVALVDLWLGWRGLQASKRKDTTAKRDVGDGLIVGR